MKPDHHVEVGPYQFKMKYHESWEGRAIYEPEVTDAFLRIIEPGDVVLDCGANLGYFTLLAGRLVGEHGVVVAFEPDPDNLRALQANVNLNEMRQVFPLDIALWSEDAWKEFHPFEHGGYSSFLRYSIGDKPAIKVLARCLDTLLIDQRMMRPKLIKVDCEGSEEAILRGAQKMLERGPAAVIAEFNFHIMRSMGSEPEGLRNYMTGLGYEMFVLDPGHAPAAIPQGARIAASSSGVANILFATRETVERHWG